MIAIDGVQEESNPCILVRQLVSHVLGTLTHRDECIPLLRDELLERELGGAFPRTGVEKVILTFQLGAPLVFSSVLLNQSQPSTVTILLWLKWLDRSGIACGSSSFLKKVIDLAIVLPE